MKISLHKYDFFICPYNPILWSNGGLISRLPPLASPILTTIFAILISFYYILRLLARKQASHVKKAGGSRPLLGHLHLLGSPNGQRVWVNLHHKAGHPPGHRGKHLGDRQGMPYHPWPSLRHTAEIPRFVGAGLEIWEVRPKSLGPYWHEVRKISILELLPTTR